jgi:hypothetical protein
MYGRRVRPHLFRVGDEVGRQIATVELHAFDDIEFEFEALGFFDGDHAFLADLFHRFGDLVTDFGSPLAEMMPTCAISDVPETGLERP